MNANRCSILIGQKQTANQEINNNEPSDSAIRKPVMIYLSEYDYNKLKELKDNGVIKNLSHFCTNASVNALDKKYTEWKTRQKYSTPAEEKT